ncbi:5-methylthioadenosine/S-adenosylhomocysteine deaminase [Methanobrevibacter cuticularis]|uniref:5-methylthioadenosine/S-adenosylhomocysteine deaminase n=1 Tax=Methanobrevibacter cuticularis TaxID=47311 RepID=A0A166D3V7_9EURY|nr:amidohydrolase family protein [Methanobrevibacter cuticularis]KZX15174.1 5-methylthioadenosine/S-adenosylhomocysteine deaminase [Methanobrevibacter cuticularis]
MITIANGTVLYGHDLIAKNTNILIDDGKILEVSSDVMEGEIIDATDCVVCPSFLNGHTHVGDSIIKDECEGKSIEEIVKPPHGIKHIALQEASDDELIMAMKKTMMHMFETGTTHFIDYREGGIAGINLLKEAASDIPINPIILGRDSIFHEDDPNMSKVKIAIRKLLKHCDGIAPSGFGEMTDEIGELIAIECEKKGKISSIHAAEYEKLQEASIETTGKTEVERAIDCGFNQLVHVTSPINGDLDLIAQNHKNLVLCPRSNGAFSNGIPPILKMLEKGIKPLIGTDNIMINSPNIFRELEYTFKIIRAFFKEYIDPREILKMVTTNACVDDSLILTQMIDKNNNKNNKENNKISNINKSAIKENANAELIIAKKSSKNPYLSLINRTETKDILCMINRNAIVEMNKLN